MPDGLGRFLANRLPALSAEQARDMRPEQFHVIANLGHGADGGARALDGVALLDGDGGGDALDAIHLGFVHPVEELAGVGREGFDVTPLAFGEEGIEGEGTLA